MTKKKKPMTDDAVKRIEKSKSPTDPDFVERAKKAAEKNRKKK